MRFVCVLITISSVVFLGCGRQDQKSPGSIDSLKKQAKGGEPEGGNQGGNDEGAKAPGEAVPRKIIYTAQVDIVVDDFEKAEQGVKELVEEQKSYLARSEMRGSPGSPRSGSWTVRVPVDHFNAFMEAVAKLGELQRGRTDSEDITDKYYDLQAHLKNNEVEEEGLRKLYLEKSSTGKLDDLLAVRRELRGVRGEIEQQKGQLQRWDKETQYATVTVKIEERKGYVPTTTPTFGTSISRAFFGSFDALVSFGKALVIFVVALTPWLPVLALVGVGVWLGVRRQRRRLAPSVAPVNPSGPAAGGQP
jgi:hypothetical protein